MFKICARTVLELGAELISSDVIAFYELIKNAYDAGSTTGAEIRFEIVLRRNDYLKYRRRATNGRGSLHRLKSDIGSALHPSAGRDSIDRFRQAVQVARDSTELVEALDNAYNAENRIIVSDNGSGMSKQDLIDNYLVIGTASRTRAIRAALAGTGDHKDRPPYIGEKGIGRLSTMRLGDKLRVETATKNDRQLNVLEIDWTIFNNLDAMLDEIRIVPEIGDLKTDTDWSGTRLIIGSLTADWTYNRVRHLGRHDFARLTDPFADAKRRPRIAIFWNGDRVPIAHMDPHLLAHAHAAVKGKLFYKDNKPTLRCNYEALDLGFEHAPEAETRTYRMPDLQGAISGTSREVPLSAVIDLGPFEFEVYWFNRRRLGRIDSIGDQKTVRRLHRRWSGILLYRDGYRVFPYGEDEDDWLALDRRALGRSRYLLNKAQFVGRVRISRLRNPQLIDQTNREGLRVCPEQEAFINLLQFVIQEQLGDFLKDFLSRHQNQPLDTTEMRSNVDILVKRARTAIRQIKRIAPTTLEMVDEFQFTFFQIKELFDKAQRRISEVENEKKQMIHMAGVGLLIEVVAHELARSTENALEALEALHGKNVPKQIDGLLKSLRSEMKTLNKRVRVLDPLSVSGRSAQGEFRYKHTNRRYLNRPLKTVCTPQYPDTIDQAPTSGACSRC